MTGKAALTATLLLLLFGLLSLVASVRRAEAGETICIRPDGSVYPSTAPISSLDDVTYTFTGNISDSIAIQRDNVLVDGASFTIQGGGVWASKGIHLSGRSNVSVRNLNIKDFHYAIYLESSRNNNIFGNNITNSPESNGIVLDHSSNINIRQNNIGNSNYGIVFEYSVDNSIFENNVTSSSVYGVYLWSSHRNSIVGNNIDRSIYCGVGIFGSSCCNRISRNSITDNYFGIILSESSGNSICHNSFIDNKAQAGIRNSTNAWDLGYPLGGNYWSDHAGRDANGDGIGDTPYVIDRNNQDQYPLTEIIPESSLLIVMPLLIETTLLTTIVFKRKPIAHV